MKRTVAWITALLLLLLLTACGGEPEKATPTKTESNSAKENGLSETLEEPLDRDLSTLVSTDELAEILRMPMLGPEMMDHDAVASYQNESGSLIVELLAEKSTRESFDAMIELTPAETTAAPNLGEVSYWVADYKTIYTFEAPYMVSVTMYADTITENDALIYSRQIALTMLENLQNGQ